MRSLIGNGAIVLDRARIGSHCIIAAGSLVPPDREIADGSVVMGAPAKLVRTGDRRGPGDDRAGRGALSRPHAGLPARLLRRAARMAGASA